MGKLFTLLVLMTVYSVCFDGSQGGGGCNRTSVTNSPCDDGICNGTSVTDSPCDDGVCNTTSATTSGLCDEDDNEDAPSGGIIIVDSFATYYLLRRIAVKGFRLTDGTILLLLRNGTRAVFNPFRLKQLWDDKNAVKSNVSQNMTNVCSQGLCFTFDNGGADLLDKLGSFGILEVDIPTFAIAIPIYAIMGIVGILGNLSLIVGVHLSKKVQSSTGILICGLAASDIFVLTYCMPLEVLNRFFRDSYHLGPIICKSWYYMKYVAVVISTNSLASMAVDRFIAVCRPLRAKSYCTVTRARVTVIGVWVVSCLLCIPVIFLTDETILPTIVHERSRCRLAVADGIEMIYTYSLMVVILGIPLGIMVPVYLNIAWVLWKSILSAGRLQGTNGIKKDEEQQLKSMRSRLQVIRMLFIALAGFVACWGPVTIYQIRRLGVDTKMNIPREHHLWFVLNTIGLANSFLNPVIYFAMSTTFRGFMLSGLRRMFCCAGGKSALLKSSNEKTTRISEVSSSIRNGTADGEAQYMGQSEKVGVSPSI